MLTKLGKMITKITVKNLCPTQSLSAFLFVCKTCGHTSITNNLKSYYLSENKCLLINKISHYHITVGEDYKNTKLKVQQRGKTCCFVSKHKTQNCITKTNFASTFGIHILE